MNLRHSRFKDDWKKLFARPYSCRLRSLTTSGLACISDGEMQLPKGPLAIIGGNGVGKSTLALAIAELLDPENVAWGLHVRLEGSSSRADGESAKKDFQLVFEIDENGERTRTVNSFDGKSAWIDAAQLAHHCRRLIDDDSNFADNLADISGQLLTSDDLEVLQYVTGRRIDACEIFEISDYGGLERFPYFRVTTGDLVYGSERMGFGELSLITLFWTLRSALPNSILVLEEPETHISPRSQSAIMDYVARICAARSIQLIVTTHSPTVVQHFPQENIWRLIRPADRTSILSPVGPTLVAELLGTGIRQAGAFLVEDAAAKYFLLALLLLMARELRAQFEVVVAGSDGEIDAALRSMPRTGKWLTLVGVYDGDARGGNREGTNWPIAYLPSEHSPERSILPVVGNPALAPQLATALARDEFEILDAIDGAIGRDGHDWWYEFARRLGIEHETLWLGFARVWLAQGENRTIAEKFIEELKVALG